MTWQHAYAVADNDYREATAQLWALLSNPNRSEEERWERVWDNAREFMRFLDDSKELSAEALEVAFGEYQAKQRA